MAKFKFSLNIGMQGEREDTIEIEDDRLDGLTEDERRDYIESEYREWTYNYIDGYWEELK